jgi:hypothetical protein
VGDYKGCPFLKLDKAHWHNRGEVEIPGEIFFSIWVDEDGRINYNIHAFKLRHLTQYRIQSREFAAAFRARFDSKGWANVSTDHGPLTLMQGWVSDEKEINSLIKGFCSVVPIIDELLEERKRA